MKEWEIKTIICDKLIRDGYTGLYRNQECACSLDDLMCCDGFDINDSGEYANGCCGGYVHYNPKEQGCADQQYVVTASKIPPTQEEFDDYCF